MTKKPLSSSAMIAEMHADIKEIKETLIPNIHTKLGVLEVKSNVWSTMTGLIGGCLAVITSKIWK